MYYVNYVHKGRETVLSEAAIAAVNLTIKIKAIAQF